MVDIHHTHMHTWQTLHTHAHMVGTHAHVVDILHTHMMDIGTHTHTWWTYCTHTHTW